MISPLKEQKITEILIFLRYYKGQYYDIHYIEVYFEDGNMIEPNFDEIIIPSDAVKDKSAPGVDGPLTLDPSYKDEIANMLEEQLNQVINPNQLEFIFSESIVDKD